MYLVLVHYIIGTYYQYNFFTYIPIIDYNYKAAILIPDRI